MSGEELFTLTSRSEAATADLARALAPRLGPGDTILLDGPIGAGKSFMARALIQARLAANGLWEDVPSPTFTLVQTYIDGICEIWHADLYRLSGPAECAELGLEDAFGDAICLVEWPDRLGPLAPERALRLEIEVPEDAGLRRITGRGPADLWADRLEGVLAQLRESDNV